MNYNHSAVKLGDKERLDSEQPGNSEPCLVTNSRVFYIINNLALVNNFSMIWCDMRLPASEVIKEVDKDLCGL